MCMREKVLIVYLTAFSDWSYKPLASSGLTFLACCSMVTYWISFVKPSEYFIMVRVLDIKIDVFYLNLDRWGSTIGVLKYDLLQLFSIISVLRVVSPCMARSINVFSFSIISMSGPISFHFQDHVTAFSTLLRSRLGGCKLNSMSASVRADCREFN